MKLRDFPLLTDENIDPDVVAHLRKLGFDVRDVSEDGLRGSADVDVMRLAASQGRVVVTHDADFGRLAILQNEPIVGIIFLRPAHIDPTFTVESVQSLISAAPDVIPPFIVVAKRSAGAVTIRVRHVGE